jgi:hypothetical protein
MFSIINVFIILILAWTMCYTISYGVWAWKENYRMGAIAVFILAAITLALPGYTIFVR